MSRPNTTVYFADLDAFIREMEKGLLFNKYALDDALTEQADLLYRVSERLSLAISQRDAAKQLLEEEKARADLDFRNAARAENAKFTETEVNNEVLLDAEVKKAQQTHNDKVLAVNRLTALKDAFVMRSYAIKDLTALYLANYYGDKVPSRNEDVRRFEDRRHEEARQVLRERPTRSDTRR